MMCIQQEMNDMHTIVTCHQPSFLPYLGVFDKIRLSDVYVILDNYQFEIGTWFNRNRIKIRSNSKPKWLTIPIRKGFSFRPVREIMISEDHNWKQKHLNMISENYRKAPFFDEYFPLIRKEIYGIESQFLIDYSMASNLMILDIFDIDVKKVIVSDLDLPEDLSPTEKLVEITRKVGGDVYHSGISGDNYLDKSKFNDVKLKIQSFTHPVYSQQGNEFVPNLCILDYLLNIGNRPWWKD